MVAAAAATELQRIKTERGLALQDMVGGLHRLICRMDASSAQMMPVVAELLEGMAEIEYVHPATSPAAARHCCSSDAPILTAVDGRGAA